MKEIKNICLVSMRAREQYPSVSVYLLGMWSKEHDGGSCNWMPCQYKEMKSRVHRPLKFRI